MKFFRPLAVVSALLAAFAVLVTLVPATASANDGEASPSPVEWTKFEQSCMSGVFSTAHRGMGVGVRRFGGRWYAEDTWQALTKGLKLGVCSVETDFWETRDGCIVSHHDPTLNRMTNRTGYIRRSTCGYVRGATSVGGAHVSTFEEIQKHLTRAVPRTCFRQQELKGFSVSRKGLRQIVKLNAKYAKAEECINYTSGNVAPLRFLHKLSPRSTYGLICRSIHGRPAINRVPKFIDRINIDYRAVSPGYLKQAARAGFEVSVRNVDSVGVYRQMRREGARIMVTDTPWLKVW